MSSAVIEIIPTRLVGAEAYNQNMASDSSYGIIQENSTAQLMNETVSHYFREREICELHNAREVTIAEKVACIIAVLTILENSVILSAITKGHRSLRKPPYWFIASLAVADLFTGFEVVLAIFIPIGDNPMSRIVLKGIAVVTFIASVNSLLLVSVDRYIRIVRHAEYTRRMNRKTIVALILGSWILSIGVFLVAPLVGWSCSEVHCCAHDGLCACLRSQFGDDVCGRDCSQSFIPFKKSYILLGVVYFAISVIIMTTAYGVIFKVVKEKTFGGGDGKSKTREVRLAKTLVITLGIFVLCWLPVQGLFIVDLVTVEHSETLSRAFDFALVPSVINSFMNPIIYSIRLPHMRTTIQRIFLPCIYGNGKSGSTWVSSTSGESRFRRFSGRKKNKDARQKYKSGDTSSSGTKIPTPPTETRERITSNKSLLPSEVSITP
uniref:cannabinoid receptor 2-like n=1 Tax=Styela clava TaxID=7725 RepID=UPI0019393498|nr:cannabinoid receptor 2-like [Styela clava]